MGAPKIGSFDTADIAVDALTPGAAAPDMEPTAEERSTIHDFNELFEPLGVAPEPPRCILAKLKSRDLVWRWLSEPSVNKIGKRMYEVYSPNAKERELINSGKDAPSGVKVDTENKVRWLDDAFLGVIPRRYYLQRQAMKRQRIIDLTKRSRDAGALKEAAGRAGAKVTDFTVEDDLDVR
jgi:hypothetical protein